MKRNINMKYMTGILTASNLICHKETF